MNVCLGALKMVEFIVCGGKKARRHFWHRSASFSPPPRVHPNISLIIVSCDSSSGDEQRQQWHHQAPEDHRRRRRYGGQNLSTDDFREERVPSDLCADRVRESHIGSER